MVEQVFSVQFRMQEVSLTPALVGTGYYSRWSPAFIRNVAVARNNMFRLRAEELSQITAWHPTSRLWNGAISKISVPR